MDDDQQMGRLLEQYFNCLFTSSDPAGFEDILDGIQPAMTDEATSFLARDFQAEEVRLALKQTAPLTARWYVSHFL